MNCVRFAFLLIILFLQSCTQSDRPEIIEYNLNLWPIAEVDSASAEQLPSRGDGVIRLTNVNQPLLEVYPADSEKPSPAVLIFPGGGYAYMAVNKEGSKVADWFNSIGVTGVVVKYTVPNNREAAFRDGRRAIRLVREHAENWNIDPDQVGVMGFSAGGHLSARLSTDFDNENYEAVDEADDQTARPDFSMLIYPAYLDDENGKKLAQEIPISDEIPPTFLVQTKDDVNYVGGTILYGEALDSANIPDTFHLFEEGGHGYGLEAGSEYEVSNWPKLAEEWLIMMDVIQD